MSEEMMSSPRLLLKATTQHRFSARSRKLSLGLLTGEHPTTWMMRKQQQQQQQQQIGSILVMGWNAFSNVTTTACLPHMCPHLSPYAEYKICPLLSCISTGWLRARGGQGCCLRRRCGSEVGLCVIICFSALAFGRWYTEGGGKAGWGGSGKRDG